MDLIPKTRALDEQLLSAAAADPEHFHEWNDLLSAFYRGLPAERLRQFLTHHNRDVLLGALFIVDEIYEQAHPVLSDVIALTVHRDAGVRASAYYAVRSCAREGKDEAFIHVLRGLRDPDPTCRVVAMMLTAQVPDATLGATVPAVEDSESSLREGLSGLLGDASERHSQIELWSKSGDVVLRRFAAITAARDPALWPTLLQLAASMGDADIGDFATKFTDLKTGLLKLKEKHAEMRKQLTLRGLLRREESR